MRISLPSILPPCGWAAGLLLAALALPAHAQRAIRDADRISAHIGLTTGLNSTWLVDNKLFDDPNYHYLNTYRRQPIGITAGLHFNDRNGLQLEVNKVEQGARFEILDPLNRKARAGTKDVKLTYWSVPLLFKYTAGAASAARFEFHVGPQFNFLQAGSEINSYSVTTVLTATPGKTDLLAPDNRVTAGTSNQLAEKADFRKSTVGAAFGLGMEFQLWNSGLYISTLLRATYALSDVRSSERVDEAKETKYYNSRNSALLGGQIGLHYQFIGQAEGNPKDRNK